MGLTSILCLCPRILVVVDFHLFAGIVVLALLRLLSLGPLLVLVHVHVSWPLLAVRKDVVPEPRCGVARVDGGGGHELRVLLLEGGVRLCLGVLDML